MDLANVITLGGPKINDMEAMGKSAGMVTKECKIDWPASVLLNPDELTTMYNAVPAGCGPGDRIYYKNAVSGQDIGQGMVSDDLLNR